MTIAVCYLSPEGVVLGADSTTTTFGPRGNHYFNHAQKVFEIGEGSTLGIVTWGMAGFWEVSYRTLLALLGDDLDKTPPKSVGEVVARWIEIVWQHYSKLALFTRVNDLHVKVGRTPEEDEEYSGLKDGLVVGFCLGGYCLPDRVAKAFEIVFDPLSAKPTGQEMSPLTHKWWGVPNIIERLLFGADQNLIQMILGSGKWTGTSQELFDLVDQNALTHGVLPIREAVDFVHTCIRSTGKAMRFSNFPQVCGGSPEIAVITTDRNFRWVRHKTWDTAIVDGG